MDNIRLNDFILMLSQKYDCTDKEESITLLSNINRAFYIDDINYMTIVDSVYTFWPFGLGHCDLFFYIRFFNKKVIENVCLSSYYSIHICTKGEDGVNEILDLLAPFYNEIREITINTLPNIDILRILNKKKNTSLNNNQLQIYKRYVPSKETYHLPDIPNLLLRPYTEATFETICQTHPEIIPCYHPNSVIKQYIKDRGIHEINNMVSEIIGFEEDFWTLFKNEQHVLSLIPIYPIGIVGFMHHHVLYHNCVSQEMINFALKNLCNIYHTSGYLIRTIPLFDDDPFESEKTLQSIGMVNDYQFVTIYRNKRKR